jgi:hypothetical protein
LTGVSNVPRASKESANPLHNKFIDLGFMNNWRVYVYIL